MGGGGGVGEVEDRKSLQSSAILLYFCIIHCRNTVSMIVDGFWP